MKFGLLRKIYKEAMIQLNNDRILVRMWFKMGNSLLQWHSPLHYIRLGKGEFILRLISEHNQYLKENNKIQQTEDGQYQIFAWDNHGSDYPIGFPCSGRSNVERQLHNLRSALNNFIENDYKNDNEEE